MRANDMVEPTEQSGGRRWAGELRPLLRSMVSIGILAGFLFSFLLHVEAAPEGIRSLWTITATRETAPVPSSGDAADDAAIWIHPTDPAQSVVLGTDKLGGLVLYDLEGRELEYRADGRINNVDLRYNFPLDGGSITLVAASNRSSTSLALYRINPATRRLAPVAARTIQVGMDSIYGLCMYRSPQSGRYYAFATDHLGNVEQWELFDNGAGQVDGILVRRFSLSSRGEGCVADDERAQLYLAEEKVGIWKYGAEPGDPVTATRIDTTDGSGYLQDDVEGLSIYYTSDGGGYLLASSQGSSSFVVYERGGTNSYLGSFRVAMADGDEVLSTDGIDVTNFALGSAFPRGMFVAQDGINEGNQNFKLTPWESIAAGHGSLQVDTGWDPRQVGSGSPLRTRTFEVEADARVHEEMPTSNFGTSDHLRVDGGGDPSVESYLRFTVSGVDRPVEEAKLRLYTNTSASSDSSLYLTSSLWEEEGITWENRPARALDALWTRGSVSADNWIEYDVTAIVTGDGSYSFVLAGNSSDGFSLSSREGQRAPHLVLLLAEDDGPVPSTTPSPTSTLVPWPEPTPSPTATETPTATATPMTRPQPTPENMQPRLWLPLLHRP